MEQNGWLSQGARAVAWCFAMSLRPQLCCAVPVSAGVDLSRHPPRGNCTTASRTAGAAVVQHPQPTVVCAAAAQHVPDPCPPGRVCLQVPSENMDHLPEPAIELWQKVVPLGMIFFCASFNLTILQVGCAVAGRGGAQSVRCRDERCGSVWQTPPRRPCLEQHCAQQAAGANLSS